MPLRYYQVDAIEAAEREFAQGTQRVLAVAATGLGKTVLFNEVIRLHVQRGERVLLLAHREELIRQAAVRLFLDTGLVAAVEMAQHKEGSAGAVATQAALLEAERATTAVASWLDDDGHEHGVADVTRDERGRPRVVVASVQSLVRRLPGHDRDGIDLVVIDECFPAGTLVGGVPIEDLRTGDLVPSYDEVAGTFVMRPVLSVMCRAPSSGLVRLHFDDGFAVVCTPAHPFLTANGWQLACLCEGMEVLSMPSYESMSSVRVANDRDPINVLEGLPVCPRGEQDARHAAREESTAARCDVLCVPEVGGDPGGCQAQALPVEQAPAGLLLGCLPGRGHREARVGDDGSHQPRARQRQDGGPQSDADDRGAREDVSFAQGQRAPAYAEGRQRPPASGSAGGAGEAAGLANGSHRTDWPTRAGAADALQAGHREPGRVGGCGDRRPFSWGEGEEGAGRSERGVAALQRVVRVEVLEPGSDGRYGGLCPDGAVYNIEVAGTHTYLVGRGLVVHNCHHAPAASYTSITDHFARARVLGVTATPQRGDNVGLATSFDVCAFEMPLPRGIEEGWLVPVRVRTIETSIDFSAIRSTAGDFNQRQLAAALSELGALHEIAGPIVEEIGDRQTIVFAVTVAHAHLLAEVLREHVTDRAAKLGRPAPGPEHVLALDGTADDDTRRKTVRAYLDGRCRMLVNCALFTEGFDAPPTEAIAMARPTKSWALYLQCLGRGTRTLPGVADALPGRDQAAERRAAIAASAKPDMLVLDFVGNSGKHQLVSALDALAGEGVPEKNLARKVLEEGEIDDVLAALAEARRRISEMEQRRMREAARQGYKAEDVAVGAATDPRPLYNPEPFDILGFRYPTNEGPPCTETQWQRLKGLGIDARGMSTKTAANLLKSLDHRRSKGLATYKQIRCLHKHARRVVAVESLRALRFAEASKMMDELIDANYVPPRSWALRFGRFRVEQPQQPAPDDDTIPF